MVFGKKKRIEPTAEEQDETEIMGPSGFVNEPVPLPPKADRNYFQVPFTKAQLMKRLDKLRESENLQLYLRVLDGEEEFEEFKRLQDTLK